MNINNALSLIKDDTNYLVLERASLNYIEDPGYEYSLYMDVETTGLSYEKEKILSLSFLKIFHDEDGEVIGHGRPVTYFNDPQRPISSEIKQLTGITDDMVKGKSIPIDLVEKEFANARIIIAHHAEFDRKFMELLVPSIKDTVWGCSFVDVDWKGMGFSNCTLEFLAFKSGYFFDAHSSKNDVIAGALLISYKYDLFPEILHKTQNKIYNIKAFGSRFDAKDDLKAIGATWNANEKVWSVVVGDSQYQAKKNEISDIFYKWGDKKNRIVTESLSLTDRFSTQKKSSLYPTFTPEELNPQQVVRNDEIGFF